MASVPRFRIGDEIGRGALGRVVRLHDDVTGEAFAGKILHASHRHDDRALARFAGEAEIVADLRHPNLVAIHGIEEVGAERVLRMELVDGDSLARLLAREGPLPAARIAEIGRGIAAGLGAAHDAGLVHRDLKPENVLIAAGDLPKIADFGLARACSFAGVEREAFAVVGTPDTMAPESIDPLSVDPRSDLYALGCILFELTTGHPPYRAATAFAVLEAHRRAPIPDLAAGPERPPGLVALIRWLLAKSPADRPQSASIVERALADLDHARDMVAAAVPPAERLGRCAACNDAVVPGVAVCFGCGAVQLLLEPGDHSVFVTGPGELTAKLGSALRQKLVDWLRANPAIGLDPTPLAEKGPRLPFVIASGIRDDSARALAGALEALGFTAEVVRGGRFSLPAMRSKAWSMSGRIGVAILVSGVWAFHNLPALLLGPVAGVAAIAAIAGGWTTAGRQVTRLALGGGQRPQSMAQALGRVTAIVPTIAQRRHRETLRGVVERALACRDLVAEHSPTADADLGELIDLAALAASRVDQLETQLAAADRRDESDDDRRRMLGRDQWAARLLSTSAFLDALRARYATVAASPGGGGHELLEELRFQIEALEQVREEL